MSVILAKDDGYIKIYEMSGGGQGDLKTPTGGWQYVQGIVIQDPSDAQSMLLVGTTRKRTAFLGSSPTLSIERWHTGGDEFSFALDRTKEYIIKLLWYDKLEGETESAAQTIQLAYCRPLDRSLSTGQPANTVSRKWSIGEITDTAFTDTSGMSWYTTNFTNQTSVVVTHNLGYKPVVWIEDTSGNEVLADVQHTSANAFTVTFGQSRSGTIHYG